MAAVQQPLIVVRKRGRRGTPHHGGAWKVAYADFVTAMMAFFMVMWLVATMPQEQLGGIAEYFRNPSAVEGRSAAMAPGRNGPGGAGDAPIRMFDNVRNPPGAGSDAKAAAKAAEQEDRRRLEALKQALEEAVAKSQALAPYKDQLLIDITPEGLRIQILDAENRPMFDLGSPRLRDYSHRILSELAQYLDRVENRLAISGHTDPTPYAGQDGYGNWELSTERANAARRALADGGLHDAKLARVVGLSSSVPFDRTDPYSPVNRRISIVVLNHAAEQAAAAVEASGTTGVPGAPGAAEAAPGPLRGLRDVVDVPPVPTT